MVTTKRCAWGTCSNDSRLHHLWKRNANGDKVFFIHFPGAKYHNEKRQRWIRACHRGDQFVCRKDSYICSLHFVGENGPTGDYPDPLSAVKSSESVSCINPFDLRVLNAQQTVISICKLNICIMFEKMRANVVYILQYYVLLLSRLRK